MSPCGRLTLNMTPTVQVAEAARDALQTRVDKAEKLAPALSQAQAELAAARASLSKVGRCHALPLLPQCKEQESLSTTKCDLSCVEGHELLASRGLK